MHKNLIVINNLIVYKIKNKTEISISIEKHDFTNANFEIQNIHRNVTIFPLICTFDAFNIIIYTCTFARISYNIKWLKDYTECVLFSSVSKLL